MSNQPEYQRSSFELMQDHGNGTPPELDHKNWIKYFQFDPKRDSASDVRNALLVVMALVAAATYQAAIKPPGGVWQQPTAVNGVTYVAGNAILCSTPGKCKVYFFFNTLAYSSSIYVISFLVYRFPFYMEIWVSLFSFLFTYMAAIGWLIPSGADCEKYAIVATFVPAVLCLVVYLVKAAAWRRVKATASSVVNN